MANDDIKSRVKTPHQTTRPGYRLGLLLISGLCLSPAYAAPNYFNYNEVHIQLGVAMPDQDMAIPHSLGKDKYSMIPTVGIRGSYQLPSTGLILSLSANQAQQSSKYSKFQQTSSSLKIGYAIGFFNRFDLYAHLGQNFDLARVCNDQQCASDELQNQSIDLGFRAWARQHLEWGMNYRLNEIGDETQRSSYSLQIAYLLTEHSSLTSSLLVSDQNNVFSIGFRYGF